MFLLDIQSASAEIRTAAELEPIVKQVGEALAPPFMRTVSTAATQAASLRKTNISLGQLFPEDPLLRRRVAGREELIGDAFITDTSFFLLQPSGSRLLIAEIRRHDVAPALVELAGTVQRAVQRSMDGRRARGMSFDWKVVTPDRRRMHPHRELFAESKLETRAVAITPGDDELAAALAEPTSRATLLRLAQLGKAKTTDAAFQADNPVLQPLLNSGLACKEYLVTCKQDSHTICTVPDRQQLEQDAGDLKCSVCGRTFKTEQVHEIVALTAEGRRMLDSSHWMTLWVTTLLLRAGVAQSDIAWNAAAGEDELDIIANVAGAKVYFELKDREFGLGDAYPFAARVSRYGGDFGIVLTADKVAEEARSFLKESRGPQAPELSFAEGKQSIEGYIGPFLTRVSRTTIRRQLGEIARAMSAAIVGAADAWMLDRSR